MTPTSEDSAQIGQTSEAALTEALQELAEAQKEIHALNTQNAETSERLDAALKRLAILEHALAPRLKSILTLRPLLFALAQRNKIKRMRGESMDQSSTNLTQANDSARKTAPETSVPTIPSGAQNWKGLGIALFGHTRPNCIRNTLESLARQDALHITHVFIDGDQGKPSLRNRINEVYDAASAYPVKRIHRQRSAFGFRKMMLTAGDFMRHQYERILFLEDDCFPVNDSITDFNRELDQIENDVSIFSVYGHPFLVPNETDRFSRFQSWGWATTTKKLEPVWRELWSCYLMPEPEYLSFVNKNLSPEIIEKINVTAGRQPTDTLQKFFAWDETVCLLTALRGLNHKRSARRLIYNCGAGLNSTHFERLPLFRKPPFNMIGEDEAWLYFDGKTSGRS